MLTLKTIKNNTQNYYYKPKNHLIDLSGFFILQTFLPLTPQ